MLFQQSWQMIAQDRTWRRQPESLTRFAAQPRAGFEHFAEKRVDEFEKLAARRRQYKGPPLKKFEAEMLLKQQDLRADRGLLNTVRHVAHGVTDAAVLGHVIKKLEVMDVHGVDIVRQPIDGVLGAPRAVDQRNVCPARGQTRRRRVFGRVL